MSQVEITPGAESATTPQSPAALISNRLVRLFAAYLGRGPTRARTLLSATAAVTVFGETMTRAEQTMVAAGEADAVHAMRQTLQGALREEAITAVEEISGRRVVAYMGDLDTHANVAALVFVFDRTENSSHD